MLEHRKNRFGAERVFRFDLFDWKDVGIETMLKRVGSSPCSRLINDWWFFRFFMKRKTIISLLDDEAASSKSTQAVAGIINVDSDSEDDVQSLLSKRYDNVFRAASNRRDDAKDARTHMSADLTFAEWMRERDVCRTQKGNPSFRSKHDLFNIAFFCNTNRLWDKVTQELKSAIKAQPKPLQVATIFLLRMAGSLREEEKPGRSGARAIINNLKNGQIDNFVPTMPFSGRKTYRAVMNRHELAIIWSDVVSELACVRMCESLVDLRDFICASVARASETHASALSVMRVQRSQDQDNTARTPNFHAVQIACDLFVLGLIKLRDGGADCPLATGSTAGLRHVRRLEDSEATIKSLAQKTGRKAHEVQTSLCEYNKYVKWYNGAEEYKPR